MDVAPMTRWSAQSTQQQQQQQQRPSWQQRRSTLALLGSLLPSKSSVTKPVGHAKYAVGFFHKFRPPPWGGGNQFLLALRQQLVDLDIAVFEAANFTFRPPASTKESYNLSPPRSNAKATMDVVYLANAITFDKKLRAEMLGSSASKLFKVIPPLVHRLDGPYYAARFERDPRVEGSKPWRAKEDDDVYRINKKFACATVYQSKWSMDMNKMLGYTPVEPVRIIPNAADPSIFHSNGRTHWEDTPHMAASSNSSSDTRVRVVTSAWSDGKRKGYDTLQWLDSNLDFTKYKLELYGRPSMGSRFKNVIVRKPVTSEELAVELRESFDIFLTPSRLEPCSNSVVEALASGLPVVYQRGSGHDELVMNGGLGFDVKEELPDILDRIVDSYTSFQGNISVTTIEKVAEAYSEVFGYCYREYLKRKPH